MVKRKAYLIDVDYITSKGQTYVKLILKGKKYCQLYFPYDPYFFSEVPEEKIKPSVYNGCRIKRIEGVEKFWGSEKKKLTKIYAEAPSDIPKLREFIYHKLGYRCYEYDIVFTKRFLSDFSLTPLSLITYERDGRVIKRFLSCNDEDIAEFEKRMGFDIEVYNPQGAPNAKKDPVIMISYRTPSDKKVISYKKNSNENVIFAKDEREMFLLFSDIIKNYDPDVIYGYNSSNFDIPYLKERGAVINAGVEFARWKGAMKKRKKGLNTGLNLTGRVHFDLYPASRLLGQIGVINVNKFTLQDVYESITGKEKFMVKRIDIWKLWDENRKELFDYSLADADAVFTIGETFLELEKELSVLAKTILFETTISTSGQLVESMLIHEAQKRNMLIPAKPKEEEIKKRMTNPIKGAFVKLPAPGIYENIAVFDFRGLYPSIIVTYNIDPFTLSEDGKDSYTSPTGAHFLKKPKGLISSTLEKLVEMRAGIKKKLKSMKKGFAEYEKLKARSQALKIISNSFYGYLGYARSRWYRRECAESVTAWGRKHIHETIQMAEEEGFKVLYADSLTSDRFVTVLDQDGMIQIQNIEELFERHAKNMIRQGEKELIQLSGYKALTVNPKTREAEWRRIAEIIRHRTNKKIFRVSQEYGETRVTEDHSIMVEKNGILKMAKPQEMLKNRFVRVTTVPPVKKVGTIDVYEYVKNFLYTIEYKHRKKTIKAHTDGTYVWFDWTTRPKQVKIKRFIPVDTEDFESLCRLLAAYIREGSSSTPETTMRHWGASISSSDTNWLRQLKADYEKLFENASAKIVSCTVKMMDLNYKAGSKKRFVNYKDNMHKLQMMDKLAAIFFRAFCGQKSSGKKLPAFIFHVPASYQKLMLKEMINGNNTHSVNAKLSYSNDHIIRNFRYTTRSLQLICGLSLLLTQLKRNYYIQYRPLKQVYTIGTCDRSNQLFKTKILEEPYSGYVYDLSLEDNHTFVDSCGQILLHNTDSLFLLLGDKSKEDALKFMDHINKNLPEKMELELEDFYKRGVFVSKKAEEKGAKKKYALMNEKGEIKIRGFELVRRDWSPVAKKTQLKVLKAILEEGSKEKAVEIVKETVKDIMKGHAKLKDLVIYTALKKDPHAYEVKSPEVAAALKLEKYERREIKSGDVIGYIVSRRGRSISEKAIPIEMAQEGEYDAEYYVNNQILPAVMKILKELGVDEEDARGIGDQKSMLEFL